MPLYTYQCACGQRQTEFRKIDDRDNVVNCAACTNGMRRVLDAPRVQVDYPGYESPVDGTWVEGRRAHKEDLARHGCRVLEPGETKAFEARKKASDEAFYERVAESAAQTVMQMPTVKREQLTKELEAGADVNYSRNAV